MAGLKRSSLSLALAMTIVLASPASAFAPVHKLAPKKVVSLAMSHPKAYARQLLALRGFGAREYGCLAKLWQRESSWWYKSKNPNSTAFGIAQMITETSRNPEVQIQHGVAYVLRRYGSPCKSWAFWQRNYYY